MTAWQPIDTATKDQDILVWYDHKADPYHVPGEPYRLTPYRTWAESGDFLSGSGVCIAKYHGAFWERADEYGGGDHLPAAWFALENDKYERVVNPIYWMPLPELPQ